MFRKIRLLKRLHANVSLALFRMVLCRPCRREFGAEVAPLLLQICKHATEDVSMEGGQDQEHEVLRRPSRFAYAQYIIVLYQ